MSVILRALLDESDATEALAEPPGCLGEPVREDETVIGTVPMDIRRMYSLASFKAQKLLSIARNYVERNDPDEYMPAEMRRLHMEADALENAAEDCLAIEFVEESNGQGAVEVRTGWKVAWNPISIDDDESEEEESDDGESDLDKRTLN